MFSATGNLLSGLSFRPDIKTFVEVNVRGDIKSTKSERCYFNIFGYIPVISTVSGVYRISLAIIHTIVHLACIIFKNQTNHNEVQLGVQNIIRAMIEILPILNMTLIALDFFRIKNFEAMANKTVSETEIFKDFQYAKFNNGIFCEKDSLASFDPQLISTPQLFIVTKDSDSGSGSDSD